MAKTRCAIYVRKSTEYGLEQEFNSLHNQEDACRAYITSQAFNGWEFYKTYTDGGISGGTMERPALREMLEDVRGGKIQCVLVYKVDRLSRSITDFHKMMQEFDKYDCSMVSITQAFDTSTSMGKLTLNMLLSFAQFESEVSAERVRDKIRASKAKGLWTGGTPHLGYDIIDKKLVANQPEVELVNALFEKYLELQSLDAVYQWAVQNGFKNKKWVTARGKTMGGRPMSKNTINKILNNHLYVGKITNKATGEKFNGQHRGIVPLAIFNQVQELLTQNNRRNTDACIHGQFMLHNKIIDADGNIFKNQASKKKNQRYRYYHADGQYLPAGDIEKITIDTIRNLLNSDLSDILQDDKIMALKSVEPTTIPKDKFLGFFIKKIVYTNNKLTYFLKPDIPPEFKSETYTITTNNKPADKIYLSADADIIIEKEIFINNRVSTNRYLACGKSIVTKSENANHLIRALSYSWRYNKMLMSGVSIDKIREGEATAHRTVYKYLNLMYLSPAIINSIMDNMIPPHIDLQQLFHIASTCTDFTDQEKAFYMT
ncbi:MAG: recombinase family protein [Rickettsiales bacterium]|jgi:DNA invertase Pin-like site-specific DNA recombinase|nr:recombinase family protein [Rickettsiales bacterium]